MIVLPESMNRLNVEETERSLSVIENYIRYMGERIEFAMRNVTKSVSDAGVSSAEMYVLLVALQNDLSALRSSTTSSLSTMSGNVSVLGTRLSTAEGNISTLQTGLSTAGSNISSLHSRVSTLEANMPTEATTDDIDAAMA